MLKIGKCRTLSGLQAEILFVSAEGQASGYVVIEDYSSKPTAWFNNGICKEMNTEYDIDLRSSLYSYLPITIPETTLPAPMRERPEHGQCYYRLLFNLSKNWIVLEVEWSNSFGDSDALSTGRAFHTDEDARVWEDFLNKYLAGK